ncbi:MAG: hypothetical protein IPJ41_18390 [Phycisphaerales bacterium]|nr:hypothetical protein [Phycisphaerales bacterium]
MHRSNRPRAIAAPIALLTLLAGAAHADTITFNFAQVGNSFSAFTSGDDPIVGKEITSARIYLDVESFAGSDAANFWTDITLPIDPFDGNTNFIGLLGDDLGWSGSGTFHYFLETTELNGHFVAARWGGETPGFDFDGTILDGSRIEIDYVPTPGVSATLALGGIAGAFRRRR